LTRDIAEVFGEVPSRISASPGVAGQGLSGGLPGDEYRVMEARPMVASRTSKGGSMALSFATDIRPLFRDGDIECMRSVGIDLDDPIWMCVPVNAESVYGAVSAGTMPPDDPWPDDRVSLFKKWMDAGCPA